VPAAQELGLAGRDLYILWVSTPFDNMVRSHGREEPIGVTSVCSAHPLVIEATLRQALADGTTALIEATSNQVDQFGGYTGLQPMDFRRLVEQIADGIGFPRSGLVLGGDHLGPNRWRDKPAEEAMSHADDLVASYVAAGYTKIHLDCSYACAGDDGPPSDTVVAARSARLLAVAEAEAARHGLTGQLRYVIGTEVPVPGGADHAIEGLVATSAESARETVRQHREAFAREGMADVWPQVMALVVQPGVEFDHLRVVDYDQTATRELRTALDDEPTMVFEAHSTDYQTVHALSALVADHWGVLKVGPGLTFALREALFALASIEAELVPTGEQSHLPVVVERRMLAEPKHWLAYYVGSAEEQALARRYSYSDRMRYYWPDPDISRAVDTLMENLRRRRIAEPLLSAFLPVQYDRVRAGVLSSDPHSLAVDRVRDVLRTYARASRTSREEAP
jgi:D-tagatose-1,6-bisphosphate aldolase subunit GatZ/KbaZ